MPGRANMSIGPLTPVTPGCTDGVLDYFFAADEDPDWIADFMALDDEVGAEDRVLVESVQRGMAAGVLEHGELLLPSEDLIAAFQEWVAGALQSRGNASVHERERDPPVALVGVEAVVDDELARRSPSSRESVSTRVRQAPRPSAELHCTRTLAESGSPSTMR